MLFKVFPLITHYHYQEILIASWNAMMAEGIIFQHGLMEDVGLWRPHPSGAPAPSLNRRALWGHGDGAAVRVAGSCLFSFSFVLFC